MAPNNARKVFSGIVIITVISLFFLHLESQEPDQKTNYSSEKSPFRFLITSTHICRKDFFLLVVVCSAVQNTARRQAIRETWGSEVFTNNSEGSVRIAFMLGANDDLKANDEVQEEARTNGDIIQGDFLDTYRNLTIKSVSLLKWVNERCSNVKYVMKADDDTYVNIPNLVQFTKRMTKKENVMFGYLYQNTTPFRNNASRWYVPPTQYSNDVYPDYLCGAGYVISRDVIPKVIAASQKHPLLFLEDVFVTGICAVEAGVDRLSASGFWDMKRTSTGCAFRKVIMGHRVTIREMRKISNQLNDKSLKCK